VDALTVVFSIEQKASVKVLAGSRICSPEKLAPTTPTYIRSYYRSLKKKIVNEDGDSYAELLEDSPTLSLSNAQKLVLGNNDGHVRWREGANRKLQFSPDEEEEDDEKEEHGKKETKRETKSDRKKQKSRAKEAEKVKEKVTHATKETAKDDKISSHEERVADNKDDVTIEHKRVSLNLDKQGLTEEATKRIQFDYSLLKTRSEYINKMEESVIAKSVDLEYLFLVDGDQAHKSIRTLLSSPFRTRIMENVDRFHVVCGLAPRLVNQGVLDGTMSNNESWIQMITPAETDAENISQGVDCTVIYESSRLDILLKVNGNKKATFVLVSDDALFKEAARNLQFNLHRPAACLSSKAHLGRWLIEKSNTKSPAFEISDEELDEDVVLMLLRKLKSHPMASNIRSKDDMIRLLAEDIVKLPVYIHDCVFCEFSRAMDFGEVISPTSKASTTPPTAPTALTSPQLSSPEISEVLTSTSADYQDVEVVEQQQQQPQSQQPPPENLAIDLLSLEARQALMDIAQEELSANRRVSMVRLTARVTQSGIDGNNELKLNRFYQRPSVMRDLNAQYIEEGPGFLQSTLEYCSTCADLKLTHTNTFCGNKLLEQLRELVRASSNHRIGLAALGLKLPLTNTTTKWNQVLRHTYFLDKYGLRYDFNAGKPFVELVTHDGEQPTVKNTS